MFSRLVASPVGLRNTIPVIVIENLTEPNEGNRKWHKQRNRKLPDEGTRK